MNTALIIYYFFIVMVFWVGTVAAIGKPERNEEFAFLFFAGLFWPLIVLLMLGIEIGAAMRSKNNEKAKTG